MNQTTYNNEVIDLTQDSDSDIIESTGVMEQNVNYTISIDIGPKNGAVAVFESNSANLVILEKWSVADIPVSKLNSQLISKSVTDFTKNIINRLPHKGEVIVVIEKQLLYGGDRTASAINCMIETALWTAFLTIGADQVLSSTPAQVQKWFELPRNRLLKKKAAVEETKSLFVSLGVLDDFQQYFARQKKRDDLSDAYLQGIHYLLD